MKQEGNSQENKKHWFLIALVLTLSLLVAIRISLFDSGSDKTLKTTDKLNVATPIEPSPAVTSIAYTLSTKTRGCTHQNQKLEELLKKLNAQLKSESASYFQTLHNLLKTYNDIKLIIQQDSEHDEIIHFDCDSQMASYIKNRMHSAFLSDGPIAFNIHHKISGPADYFLLMHAINKPYDIEAFSVNDLVLTTTQWSLLVHFVYESITDGNRQRENYLLLDKLLSSTVETHFNYPQDGQIYLFIAALVTGELRYVDIFDHVVTNYPFHSSFEYINAVWQMNLEHVSWVDFLEKFARTKKPLPGFTIEETIVKNILDEPQNWDIEFLHDLLTYLDIESTSDYIEILKYMAKESSFVGNKQFWLEALLVETPDDIWALEKILSDPDECCTDKYAGHLRNLLIDSGDLENNIDTFIKVNRLLVNSIWGLGDIQDALSITRESISYSDNPQLIELHVDMLIQAGSHEEALPILQRNIAESPDDPSLLNDYGIVLANTMGNSVAVEYYEDLAARYPENFNIRSNYANELHTQGDFEKAENIFKQNLEITNNSDEIYFSLKNLALLELEKGSVKSAEKYLVEMPPIDDFYFSEVLSAINVLVQSNAKTQSRMLKEHLQAFSGIKRRLTGQYNEKVFARIMENAHAEQADLIKQMYFPD